MNTTTTRSAQVPELTVDIAELYLLLADTADSAGTDPTLPMLNGVLLHTDTNPAGTPVLVGTSTDRFLLGQAHTTANSGQLAPTFVPLRGVRAMRAALDAWWRDDPDDLDNVDDDGDPLPPARPGRRREGGIPVRLARHPDALTLTIPMADTTVAVRVDLADTQFPTRLSHLFTETSSADPVSIAPRLWRALARIADRRDTGITIRPQGARTPVAVHIGNQYRALVMPLKPVKDQPASEPPVFLPPTPDRHAA